MSNKFDHLAKQWTVVVTTFRRDGSGVQTPVNIVVEGDHAYMRSWSTSGKAKRPRHEANLEIAPSTFRGKPTGPEMKAEARLLEGEEDREAARRIDHKYPVWQGWLVHFTHRVRKYKTVHYELTAA